MEECAHEYLSGDDKNDNPTHASAKFTVRVFASFYAVITGRQREGDEERESAPGLCGWELRGGQQVQKARASWTIWRLDVERGAMGQFVMS